MKYPDLVKCVREHNNNLFPECDTAAKQSPCGDRSPSCINVSELCGQLCGFTNTADDVTQLLDKWLLLQDQSQKTRRVAVGSVVDIGSNPQDDLPVVLAVGINYGQGDWYADNPVPLEDNTQLRGQAFRTLHQLKISNCCLEDTGSFHLAAANFFPWITKWSWSGLNSIEEAILLRCAQLYDPVRHVVSLIQKMEPQVVMFHGANNAVPGLGLKVVEAIPGSERLSRKYVFSDNLAPPQRSVSNGVMIPRPPQRQYMHKEDIDS